ncbi:MAG: CPBP family intramembrane metalloprotease [Verrucomicrobiales bacterium]|nr:CPBP family intramembrane metalloprotease [Verrucomicrobiales bacterium]
MKAIFWNAEEHRLRAGWRVVLFGVLLLVTAIPAGFIREADAGSLYTRLATSQGLWMLLLLAATAFLARFVDRRPFSDYGLTRGPSWGLNLIFGLVLGAAMMGLVFGFELAVGWIRIKPAAARWASEFHAVDLGLQVLLFAAVAVGEELTDRGYLLKNLAEGFNRGTGPSAGATLGAGLVGALIFGLMHSGNESASVLTSLNIGVAGLFLGLGFLWTRSLAIPMGAHFSWNFFQGPIFGFPVSGENVGQTVFDIAQGGPVVMTGGTFGPEGGLLSTVVTLLGIGAIALWVRWREGAVRLRPEISCAPASRPAAPVEPAPTSLI